jgi:uncharacterized protein RhaS with RHS repeats
MISDGQRDYSYDYLNRLASVKDHASGNQVASYTYDHMGRRTSKTEGSTTTYYHWDGNNLAEK